MIQLCKEFLFIPTTSFFVLFWYRVSVCISGCLGTHYGNQAVLALREICLPLKRWGKRRVSQQLF